MRTTSGRLRRRALLRLKSIMTMSLISYQRHSVPSVLKGVISKLMGFESLESRDARPVPLIGRPFDHQITHRLSSILMSGPLRKEEIDKRPLI